MESMGAVAAQLNDAMLADDVKGFASFLEAAFEFYAQGGRVIHTKMKGLNMSEYEADYKAGEDILELLEQKVDHLVAEAKTKESESGSAILSYFMNEFGKFKDTEITPLCDKFSKKMEELKEKKIKYHDDNVVEWNKLQPIIDKITKCADTLKIDPVDDNGKPVENLNLVDGRGMSFPTNALAMLPFVKDILVSLGMKLDDEKEGTEGKYDYLKALEEMKPPYASLPSDVQKNIDDLKAEFLVLDSPRAKLDVVLKTAQKAFMGLRFNVEHFKKVAVDGINYDIDKKFDEHEKRGAAIVAKQKFIMEDKLQLQENKLGFIAGCKMTRSD